jgi:hypothetical protein
MDIALQATTDIHHFSSDLGAPQQHLHVRITSWQKKSQNASVTCYVHVGGSQVQRVGALQKKISKTQRA